MAVETKENSKKYGFTLIELLVVIAIIGLLASVVLVALNGSRSKARDAKRISDMTTMASALELYFNDFNTYPTVTVGSLATAQYPAGMTPTYIGQIPVASTPVDGSCGSVPGTLNGTNSYEYVPTINGTTAASYTYAFCLGSATGRYSPGPHTLTSSGIQ